MLWWKRIEFPKIDLSLEGIITSNPAVIRSISPKGFNGGEMVTIREIVMHNSKWIQIVLYPLFMGITVVNLESQVLPTPEEYFGFEIGADKKLARWDGILEYLTLVGDQSDRIKIDTLGSTTLGNPFLSVTISSPANLARLEEIRYESKLIADGRITKSEALGIAHKNPATVFINHNIHSTEIGSSQTSIELVYGLATQRDDLTNQILDNVVTVLIPSANPDGQIMVADWYDRNVNTDFERARMPWLYHHYAGHDNNRDFFQANLVETRYWMKEIYHKTFPQVYLDQHQMGGSGPRMFVPPYPDPMNPMVHPLQWQQLRFIGGGMVADLQEAGKQGVVTGSMYRIWGQEGALTGRYHNIVAILTETASAHTASPDTVALSALQRGASPGRGLSEYGFQMAFVDPWWGGEWSLSDIVDYQMVSAISVLEQTAKFKDHYIMGRWQMGSETIAKGEKEGPRAYVIPRDQKDPNAAVEMVNKLILGGIEIHENKAPFQAIVGSGIWEPFGGPVEESIDSTEIDSNEEMGSEDEEVEEMINRMIPEGSWIVYGAQPGRAAVFDLITPQRRRVQREWPDGPFMRSYDGAAYTMPMQMGVEVIRVDSLFEVEGERIVEAKITVPSVPMAHTWYGISAEVTRSYEAVNRILDAGHSVFKAETTFGPMFLMPTSETGLRAILSKISKDIGLVVIADPPEVSLVREQRKSRLGVYQGWAGSMDEGWTRLVLEDFEYQYRTLMDDDVQRDDLSENLDVIIIPSEIPLERLIQGASDEDAPPEYTGGIGDEGVESLKAFVRDGGTLITFERADALVLEHFEIPIRNALEDIDNSDLFLPSSLFRLELDQESHLTFGQGAEVPAKWAGGRAYEPTDFGGEAKQISAVANWARDTDRLLMSGAIVGAEYLAGKSAIVDIAYGSGRIIMYGFRVQHRGQTHGTYKLLFNALLLESMGTLH